MKRIYRHRKEKVPYRTVFLLTEEERARKRPKNLNGGRPPDGTTLEQFAEWRRDMDVAMIDTASEHSFDQKCGNRSVHQAVP